MSAAVVRVCRREDDAHHPAGVDSEQRRTLRLRGVHDRAHIFHPRLNRGVSSNWVRHPGSALVELDHARERRQRLEKFRAPGKRPAELDIGDVPGREHEIDRPVADYLVGDRNVTVSCVTGCGKFQGPHFDGPSKRRPPNVIEYAIKTHCRLLSETCKELLIDGSATVTIVPSGALNAQPAG